MSPCISFAMMEPTRDLKTNRFSWYCCAKENGIFHDRKHSSLQKASGRTFSEYAASLLCLFFFSVWYFWNSWWKFHVHLVCMLLACYFPRLLYCYLCHLSFNFLCFVLLRRAASATLGVVNLYLNIHIQVIKCCEKLRVPSVLIEMQRKCKYTCKYTYEHAQKWN